MFSAFSNIKVDIFGESHAEKIGVKLSGIPEGVAIDFDKVQAFVDRRKSGKNVWSTPRKEPDIVVIESGFKDGITTGETIVATIANTVQRSKDYSEYKDTPRPSHADYVSVLKDGDKAVLAGGGRFSGRMTAPMCIAGAMALQILENKGVRIGAYVSQIAGIKGESYDEKTITYADIEAARKKSLCVIGDNGNAMEKAVVAAKEELDSVGGTVEAIIYNAPSALGDALYQGTEGRIACSLFAIPAVKSVEIGLGTGFAAKKGSEANDAFCYKNGILGVETNNNGGINGGITNGNPITVRVTLKPTPSIQKEQRTVNLATKENVMISIKGRHDACIVPRAVPVVEAALALTMLDMTLDK